MFSHPATNITTLHVGGGAAADADAAALDAISNNFEPAALYPLLGSQRSSVLPERENGSRGDRTIRDDSGGGPQFQEQV